MIAWLLAAAAALVLARRRYVVVRVCGGSMAPAFADGDRVLVRRGRPRVGDAIVFRPPVVPGIPGDPRWRLKRVAALAGEPVPLDVGERVAAAPGALVPDRYLVVRGDAARSEDSRHYGYVRADAVLGAVVLRLARRRSTSEA